MIDNLPNGVMYIEKAIPNVNEILEHFKNTNNLAVSDWDSWRDDNCKKIYGKTKSFYQDYFNEKYCDEKTLSYINQVLDSIDKYCNMYSKEYGVTSPRNKEKNFAISHYVPGDDSFLRPHIDTPENFVGEEHSILIYWNDDYEGGELIFNKFDLEIKPKSGDMFIFSSTDKDLVHSTNEVTKGIKYFTIKMWRDGAGKGFVPLCKCEICLVRPQRCIDDAFKYRKFN